MTITFVISPRRLSDRELIDRVRDLARHEGRTTAHLVAHLAELDERRLYVAEGCVSLFVYCTEVLHLSEAAAYNRIEAARVAQRFPVILERLADGSVHVTAVRMLAQYLTAENHRDLLDEATHKSKRALEEIIARLRPLPPVPASVRKLPATARTELPGNEPAAPALDFSGASEDVAPGAWHADHHPGSSPVVVAPAGSSTSAGKVSAGAGAGSEPSVTRPRDRAKVAALAPDSYRVQFTADAETYKLLCQARELLKHQVPDGDAAAVIGLALKVLVEKVAKQKFAATKKPAVAKRQPAPGAVRRPNSRRIPAAVKREVWSRDRGQCAFVAPGGRRCTERGRLEFHHVEPFARGGPPTLDNIQLRCRVHNQHESELCFGPRPVRTPRPNSSRNELEYVMRPRSASASTSRANIPGRSG